MSDEHATCKNKIHTSHHRTKALRRLYRSVFKRQKPTPRPCDFNPEEHFCRKKEWLEHRSGQDKGLSWPEHCFEHLVIVGLPHTMDIAEVIQSVGREQGKLPRGPSELTSASVHSEKPNHTPPKPSYTPELLYQFPEDKPLHMTAAELVSFCFPHGVTPHLLRRTPSLGALNEVVYGQQHFIRSDQSFVFLQKGGGDELPMYGVCYLVNQMLHTPPGLVKHKYKEHGVSPSKHMVAAPRCYCLLSRYPFFELHFQVLNLVLGLERLDSISDYMNEVVKLPHDSSLFNCLGSAKSTKQLRSMTPDPCAIRAFSASPPPPPHMFHSLSSAAPDPRSGLPPESDLSSQTQNAASDGESQQANNETPLHARDSFSSQFPITAEILAVSNSQRSELSSQNKQRRATGLCRSLSEESSREGENPEPFLWFTHGACPFLGASDSAYMPSELRPYSATPPASTPRYAGSGESDCLGGLSSSMPDLSSLFFQGSGGRDPPYSDTFIFDNSSRLHCLLHRSPSSGELARFPSTKATRAWSEDPQEIMPACQKLLCDFRSLKVPSPGEKIVFAPEEEGLQRIEYTRPRPPQSWRIPSASWQLTERALMEEETAFGLRSWTIMVLCRSLSLDNILSLLAGAMLERQIVFFCSNIGVLTSAVLSLIPLLRPFTWQSLILPALPTCYLEFLEAPVPFAVGIQHKTPEIAQRCTNLIRVNLYKDKIKNAPAPYTLPGYKSLYSDLSPWHKKLQECSKYSRRPSHVVTSPEYIAVEAFLRIMRGYLTHLLADLERHTITDVTSPQGVSLLLEDSLIESFPAKDQPFMKEFVTNTQMFPSFVDCVLGT